MAKDDASLTIAELGIVRDFLRQADMLVSAVRGMLLSGGNTKGARRLKEAADRLADQIKEIEDIISNASR
jgi:hypothetical protein